MPTGKTIEHHAAEANQKAQEHESLYRRSQKEAHKPGISKLRHQVSAALHARMRAELKASST